MAYRFLIEKLDVLKPGDEHYSISSDLWDAVKPSWIGAPYFNVYGPMRRKMEKIEAGKITDEQLAKDWWCDA